jgi:hypothetical protein
MRNAQNAALMAFFAEVERRETEEQSRAPVRAWEQVKRPISIDLQALTQNFRKARA